MSDKSDKIFQRCLVTSSLRGGQMETVKKKQKKQCKFNTLLFSLLKTKFRDLEKDFQFSRKQIEHY